MSRDDWEVSSLDDLCNFQNGYAFQSRDFQDDPKDAFVVFKMGNIEKGGGLRADSSQQYISHEYCRNLARFVLEKGDIVMCMTDMKASMALLGHTALIDRSNTYIVNQRVGRITVKRPDKLHHLYLYYYSNSKPYIDHLRSVAHSGVQVNLSTEEIRKSPIVYPPLPIQHRIASILSAYDDLIVNNTQRIKALEAAAQALYREWFVEFRFPGWEQIEWVEELPEGWSLAYLGEIARINAASLKTSTAPEQINYIDIASVSVGHIDAVQPMSFLEAPGRARRIVRHGDIIWSCVRPNRRSYAIIINPVDNLIVSTGFATITPVHIPYSYLYYALTTDEFVEYLVNHATGSAYPAVSQGDFENAQVLLPPTGLVEQFHNTVADMFGLQHTLSERNRTLRETRDLLLPRLISGEVSVE